MYVLVEHGGCADTLLDLSCDRPCYMNHDVTKTVHTKVSALNLVCVLDLNLVYCTLG